MTIHFVVARPIFPPDWSNVSETSVVEHRKLQGNLKADKPGLATVKNNANYGIIHHSHEGNLDFMAITSIAGFQKPV